MTTSSVIHINLSAIDHNIRTLRRIIGPQRKLCAVVKANAYGLGARRIARKLHSAGVDMFAVFGEDEAAAIFEAAIHTPVLVLAPVRSLDRSDELYRAMIRGLLHLTVHDLDHAEQVAQLASRFGAVLPIHVEVDTGMGRGGCSPDEAVEVVRALTGRTLIRIAGVFTHLARARMGGTFSEMQLGQFDDVIDRVGPLLPEDCLLHVGATCATLRHRRFHSHMVRVGLGWAGYGSQIIEVNERVEGADQLRPAVRWTSELAHIKTIEAGTSVGYGAGWTATRQTRLGLVPVGYGDGYPSSLAAMHNQPMPPVVGVDTGSVEEPLHYAPVVGAISMDQLMVDLTDISASTAAVGAQVVLISDEYAAPNELPTLARHAGCFPYQLLCRLHPDVPRSYFNDNVQVDVPSTERSAVLAR